MDVNHVVNEWYLFTSLEHYHTHYCCIKHTKSKQLSDMVQFQHKCITNGSITHADKVMHTLADCIKAIQGRWAKLKPLRHYRTYSKLLMQHKLIYMHT
jgi:hypothetical protein